MIQPRAGRAAIPAEGARRLPPPVARLAGLLVLLALSGLPVAARAGDPADGGSAYRRPIGHDPATLDPARIRDVYSLGVAQQIFDGLVQFDHTLSVTPALAQYWRASRDGLVWTFQLRKGVRFHHGREVTADDVIFSLTRLLDPKLRSGAADLFLNVKGAAEYRAGTAARVAGLTAPDRHTVQVELTDAPLPFVSQLAVGHAKVVPRELAEQQGEAFGQRPVGTGPFRFVRWDREREIVLAANADYWDGAPRLARIVFRIYPGGKVDAMHEDYERGLLEDTPVPTRDYRRIVAAAGTQYVRRPMFSLRHYGFNLRIKPFDDRRIRQALASAIDRQAIVEEIYLGRYTVARGILPPGTLSFNPKLAAYGFDVARARELLAAAGHPGGRGLAPVVIWSSVRHEGILREHEMIRRALQAIGVTAEFQYLTDWPAFLRGLEEGRFPMFLHAWFADVPDPDNFLFKLFHSRSPRNFFGYANPLVDETLARARRERDAATRAELYRQAEQLVVHDAPNIPIWHYTYERLFQPYVRSVEVSGLGDPYIPLRRIWLEGRR